MTTTTAKKRPALSTCDRCGTKSRKIWVVETKPKPAWKGGPMFASQHLRCSRCVVVKDGERYALEREPLAPH